MSNFNWISNGLARDLLINGNQELTAEIDSGHHLSAIVLAGSLSEMLLLYALDQHRVRALTTYAALYPRRAKSKSTLEELDLGEMIRVARKLDIVTSSTLRMADEVRNFRNLIHPGFQIRSKLSPTRRLASISDELFNAIASDIRQKQVEYILWDGLVQDWHFEEKKGYLPESVLQNDGARAIVISGLSQGSRAQAVANPHGNFSPVEGRRGFLFDVYVDKRFRPEEVMIQFKVTTTTRDGDEQHSWEHRAIWGKDIIRFSKDGEFHRTLMGDIPPSNGWHHVVVDLQKVKISHSSAITGFAWTLGSSLANKKIETRFARMGFL